MYNFNVRVYGILQDEKGRVLVSDEFIRGDYVVKFPGGGLELGEGTRDCLIREFKEETGLDVEIGEHLYTTDFYQQSAFNAADQIISIYYFVKSAGLKDLAVHTTIFDFRDEQIEDPHGESEVFRWVEWADLKESTVTLPIDKVVVKLLLERFAPVRMGKGSDKKYFIQDHPFLVPTSDGKMIEEHFGLATTGHDIISIAHMIAPAGWEEPSQTPLFDEWTLIVSGKKSIEIDGETVIVFEGQSILISKGAKVRYSNPFEVACEYWSVCIPAFSLERVRREL